MLVEQTYLSIAVTSILILLGNIVMLKKPFVGCILRAAGFALATILIQGPNIFAETLIVASSVTGITLSFYTYSYSRNKYGDLALTPLTDVLLLSMIILFQAKTLIEFIGFWLLTELIAFFLIAYEYIVKGDAQSIRAAIKYLIVSMIPTDLSLFIMLGLAGFEEALTRPLMEFNLGLQNPAILSTVILGFFSKAAVIPLHFWLPDAHSIAPSPASALLSGLMVKMGVYGLYLLSLQQLDKLLASLTMVLLGGLTAIYGAIQVLVQEDIKRFLAYSTISETGLISLLIGLYIFSGDNIFLVSSIAYSVAHALYKTLMFMDAGYIEVVAHTRSIRGLGFIHRLSPLQTTSILMNIASYLGMPPSTGFLAKLTIFTAITKHITHSHIYIIVLLITVVKVMISVIYNGVYLKTHFGKEPLSNIANTYQSGDDLMLNMSCLVSSVYTYIITIPLLYLLIYEGGFAEVKYLRTLLPFAVVLTIISLLLYLLIYKTIKRERDDAKSFYTPNFSYANRFLGLYAILVFSITLVLGITNKDLMLLEAGFKTVLTIGYLSIVNDILAKLYSKATGMTVFITILTLVYYILLCICDPWTAIIFSAVYTTSMAILIKLAKLEIPYISTFYRLPAILRGVKLIDKMFKAFMKLFSQIKKRFLIEFKVYSKLTKIMHLQTIPYLITYTAVILETELENILGKISSILSRLEYIVEHSLLAILVAASTIVLIALIFNILLML